MFRKKKLIIQSLIKSSETLGEECKRLISLTTDMVSITSEAINRPIVEIMYADATVQCPEYKTVGSSGMDVRAWISDPIIIEPGQRTLVPTGITLALQPGYEIQVRPRSGLALNNGITVLNTPGTVDSKIN